MGRILLDVDGVVASFTEHLCAKIAMECDAPDMSTFQQWDFLKHHLTEQQRKVAYSILTKTEFWATQPVIEGARDAVELLHDNGHDVHFVTHAWSGCFGWADTRIQWIEKNLGVKHQFVHVAGHKHVYAGDVFVDDKFDNVAQWAAEQKRRYFDPNYHAFLFSAPYNATSPWSGFRLNGWSDSDGMRCILDILAVSGP